MMRRSSISSDEDSGFEISDIEKGSDRNRGRAAASRPDNEQCPAENEPDDQET